MDEKRAIEMMLELFASMDESLKRIADALEKASDNS